MSLMIPTCCGSRANQSLKILGCFALRLIKARRRASFARKNEGQMMDAMASLAGMNIARLCVSLFE